MTKFRHLLKGPEHVARQARGGPRGAVVIAAAASHRRRCPDYAPLADVTGGLSDGAAVCSARLQGFLHLFGGYLRKRVRRVHLFTLLTPR